MTRIRHLSIGAGLAAALLSAACTGPAAPATTPQQAAAPSSTTPAGTPSSDAAGSARGRVQGKDAAFSVALPEPWVEVTPLPANQPGIDLQLVIAEEAPASATNFRNNINIGTQKMPAGVTAEAYARQAVQAIRRSGATPRGVVRTATLDGAPTAYYGWTKRARGITLAQMQQVAIRDGLAYVITLSAPQPEMAEASDQLERVVTSWKWGPAQPS